LLSEHVAHFGLGCRVGSAVLAVENTLNCRVVFLLPQAGHFTFAGALMLRINSSNGWPQLRQRYS